MKKNQIIEELKVYREIYNDINLDELTNLEIETLFRNHCERFSEEIEMGSGNLVRSIEVVEVDMVESLTNQLQGGVRHGAKDGAAGYINQDTLHQNVSSESAFESDFYRTAVISL